MGVHRIQPREWPAQCCCRRQAGRISRAALRLASQPPRTSHPGGGTHVVLDQTGARRPNSRVPGGDAPSPRQCEGKRAENLRCDVDYTAQLDGSPDGRGLREWQQLTAGRPAPPCTLSLVLSRVKGCDQSLQLDESPGRS
ncbi:hypothetical protein E2C01_017018 [Portunus trituberculatus]|uniref:Uncharacterized protein n=1 Tax=Portunus trituberculatus TaxID=210409 RepID=A0A5B7DR58_PORTR|nr:hypothetical protein [Portunus trituberculatus]